MRKLLSIADLLLVLCIGAGFLFESLDRKLINKPPFVTADLNGQLGNQMFIIAAAVNLALENGAEPVFPWLENSTALGVTVNREKIFHRLNSYPLLPFQMRSRVYESNLKEFAIPYNPNMSLSGYFQSEKYFKKHKKEILELFAPLPEIEAYLSANYHHILEHANAVSIHLRNYQMEDASELRHVTLPRAYYEKAISHFPEDSLFVVFSNDIPWAKELLKGIKKEFHFIENEKYYNEIYLMSRCTHHIICNSSFSWWGAYMNENLGKIVIAPNVWLSLENQEHLDKIIPEGWMMIDAK